MLILAFESSCDETSAAVVEMTDSRRIIKSNIVASQIKTHRLYGGVVPEIASRAHSEAISKITYEALDVAGVTLGDIDAIGVTNTPGLIGALLVGVNFAKSLAFANNIPLVPVNHIKGHVAANYFAYPELKPPFIALVVSGGHTSLISVDSYTEYKTVGHTRDDAAGEAFDKVGRVLGLSYPCGAEMDALAKEGDPDAIKLPMAAIGGDNLDLSFSGLKTAVVNYMNTASQKGEDVKSADVAASFTKSAVNSITVKLEAALDKYGYKTLVLAGGVAANSHLRGSLEKMCARRGVKLCMPPLSLCGDNGAMIGAQCYFEYKNGVRADSSLNAYATGSVSF
ncbi:MAG: tRNA (adenosine(37)-N6)-threonylcarbamoyltransferase complex transferase subunit TsaD [Ruminococcaceae bacterium]|nr:tRNA (adenosine(37)-N6)-threonylcarbamoyltransferase complex transferase subunit TsaD [Oscillospiraceae bacterium]